MERKNIKCIEWHISSKCNYNCSYCLRKDTSLDIVLKNSLVPAKIKKGKINVGIDFLIGKFIQNFRGSWDILISGSGEPFIVPNFLELIKKLISSNFKIAVQTNLSLPVEEYVKFCKICGDGLIEIRASLHLEKVEADDFLSKVLVIRKYAKNKIKVRTVARKNDVVKLLPVYKKFYKKNVEFYLQIEKIRHKNKQIDFSDYCKRELSIIKIVNSKINFVDYNNFLSKSKKCLTGKNFVLINEFGEVWSCTPAQRDKNKKLNFGNIYFDDKIFLLKKPHICKYKYCYCPMPLYLKLVE